MRQEQKKIPFSKYTFLDVFDPSLFENTYWAFNNYIEGCEISYHIACIRELKEEASKHVQQQHKAKVFRMCTFQGEQLKTDLKSEFNQDLAQLKQILTLWCKDSTTGTGPHRTKCYSITSFMASAKSTEKRLTTLLIR